MKIGIVTQPLLNNYGGVLQNYALQNVLTDFGHRVVTIDFQYKSTPFWKYLLSWMKTIVLFFISGRKRQFAKLKKQECRLPCFDSFVLQYIKKTQMVKRFAQLKGGEKKFDVIIAGSDQVWRPRYSPDICAAFLNFVKGGEKRLSYAASFGVDEWEFTPKQTKICAELAKKFDAISVRENSGVDLCKKHLGVDATCVLDPTLLLKKEDYLQLCQDVPINANRFMAVYVLNLNDSVKATYEKIAKEKNLEVKYFAADAKATLSVPEWLAMFRDASYVVTDSFHGTVFSIIFEKEFKCIYNEARGAARFESLLNLYNSGRLEEMREFSLNWLKNALDS